MEIDDETRAALGWGTGEDREDGLHVNKQSGHQPSRIAPGDVDGRSKRNWRHRNMPANGPSRSLAAKATPNPDKEAA